MWDAARRFVTGTNYCGPGGSGETLGEVDEACAKHDASYTAPYLYDYIESQRADSVFLRDIEQARPFGIRQSVTKYLASRYFDTKVRIHSMRQGRITDPNFGFVKEKPRSPKTEYKHKAPQKWRMPDGVMRERSRLRVNRFGAPVKSPWFRSKRYFKRPYKPFQRVRTFKRKYLPKLKFSRRFRR